MSADKDDNIIYSMHARFCNALASEKRFRIFHLLEAGELSVGGIASQLRISPSNTSRHLHLMRDIGLVKVRRKGNKKYYRLASVKFSRGYRLIREGLAEIHFSKDKVLFLEDMNRCGKDGFEGD